MRRYPFILYLILVFTVLSSGLASAWQNVNTHQQVNHFKNERLDLICTGDELRWIDPVASIEQGQFVFVAPPQDAPQQLQHPDCGLTHLADNAATAAPNLSVAHSVSISNKTPQKSPHTPTTQRYHQPQLRAPPLLT
ncbi:hypothetical protein [Pseudidiomarina salilacus]|uniref:hypothetical protein n=1 Tax=Pseudidiomarina salilacus TaxID=3384452 RepID=UPI0039855D08